MRTSEQRYDSTSIRPSSKPKIFVLLGTTTTNLKHLNEELTHQSVPCGSFFLKIALEAYLEGKDVDSRLFERNPYSNNLPWGALKHALRYTAKSILRDLSDIPLSRRLSMIQQLCGAYVEAAQQSAERGLPLGRPFFEKLANQAAAVVAKATPRSPATHEREVVGVKSVHKPHRHRVTPRVDLEVV